MATTAADIIKSRQMFRARTEERLYKLVRKAAMKTAKTSTKVKDYLESRIEFIKNRLNILFIRIEETEKNMKKSKVSKTTTKATAVESAEEISMEM